MSSRIVVVLAAPLLTLRRTDSPATRHLARVVFRQLKEIAERDQNHARDTALQGAAPLTCLT